MIRKMAVNTRTRPITAGIVIGSPKTGQAIMKAEIGVRVSAMPVWVGGIHLSAQM